MPAAPPSILSLGVDDFSERRSPMVVKELRQGLRQRFFVLPFIFIHLCALFALFSEWTSLQGSGSAGNFGSFNSRGFGFWLMTFIVVGVLMPLRGFESLQAEMDRGNNELLVLSGLTRWQIVRGKCGVQLSLCLLTLCSLLPYLLVRYFFGGFDLVANVLQLLNVLLYTLSTTAVIVGASGYKSYAKRFALLIVGLGYVSLLASGMGAYIMAIESGGMRVSSFLSYYYLFTAAVAQFFYAVTAMQIARGHLKLFLRPWESPPSAAMVVLFVASPCIFAVGGVATLGMGIIAFILLFLLIALYFDKSQSAVSPPPAASLRPPVRANLNSP